MSYVSTNQTVLAFSLVFAPLLTFHIWSKTFAHCADKNIFFDLLKKFRIAIW